MTAAALYPALAVLVPLAFGAVGYLWGQAATRREALDEFLDASARFAEACR